MGLFGTENMQIPEEFDAFLNEVKRTQNTRVIMEIGTSYGHSLDKLIEIADFDATLISVDLLNGKYGGVGIYDKIDFQAHLKGTQKLRQIYGNSHQSFVFDQVLEELNGRQLDLLFIDGDHSYAGVKQDYLMYSKKVKKGGIVAFHDIVKHDNQFLRELVNREVGVHKFWNELKEVKGTNWKEIIKDPSQTWAGIGLIYV